MTWCQHISIIPIIVLLILYSLTVNHASCSPVTDRSAVSEQYAASSSAQQQAHYTQPPEEQDPLRDETEEEDELFKDVDPRTLAAVLLEALNQPQKEKISEREDEADDMEQERDLEGADRDRDGHEELELVMAAARGNDKEKEEEEERKRAEEEERMTEKVASRTTSQTVPIKEQGVPEEAATQEEVIKEEERQEPKTGKPEGEEQLSSEEVKNLESMLEEFQSYSTAAKRERDTIQRESRGEYFDYLDRNGLMNNEIKPKAPKESDLSFSKKKLKWQLEQENNRVQSLQKGGNFMDDFNTLADPNEEDEDDQEDEEQLTPEEEESRAKAEQEEVRRQAAEAQRAKAEEEKLADIASDMLLKYIGKQDKKKYQVNNGAEDKRSDEETSDDDDDIDPQTIDKLIEISSKLHLPADDVVDIINDVEKKKKKDAPENLPWQRPLMPPPAPDAPSTMLRKPLSSKPPPPNTNPLKSWFKDRDSIKPSKQDLWAKQQWPFRPYPSYSFYQKPYRGYYPIYIPPPKPKPRYYSKPSFSLNEVLGNSLDYDFDYSPRWKSRPWAQPPQRVIPAFHRSLYIPHPRTYSALPMPKASPRIPPRRWPSFYFPPRSSVVTREDDYYSPSRKLSQNSDEEMENLIERVLKNNPQMLQ